MPLSTFIYLLKKGKREGPLLASFPLTWENVRFFFNFRSIRLSLLAPLVQKCYEILPAHTVLAPALYIRECAVPEHFIAGFWTDMKNLTNILHGQHRRIVLHGGHTRLSVCHCTRPPTGKTVSGNYAPAVLSGKILADRTALLSGIFYHVDFVEVNYTEL